MVNFANEWQPRLGVAWDPWRDGATRLYAFAGRFYYSLPTSVAVRGFGGVFSGLSYNFDPIATAPEEVPGHPSSPSTVSFGTESVDDDLHGVSVDEFSLGVQRRFGKSLTVGLTASYRRLSHAVEDRCDLDSRVEGPACAMVDTGGSGKYARGDFYSCTRLDPPYDPCFLDPSDPNNYVYGAPALPPARRIYRGLQLLAQETLSDDLWIQASFLYSSLRGNYDGAVNEGFFQTSPGINLDFDYPPLLHNDYGRLYLDRPIDARVSGSYRTPWRLSVGLETYVLSGPPLDRLGYLNAIVGRWPMRLDARGYAGRMPTQWEANLTLEYPLRVGPTTVTLQAFVFNLFNNQIRTGQDMVWSLAQPPGYPDSIYDPNQPQTNANYGKITARQPPRLFRAALRVSF